MTPARLLPLVCFSLLLLPVARGAESVVNEGRVAAVTVYQGQALVTREITLDQAGGLMEIVVTNLPEKVQPGSLYAEPNDGVEVRSVRYRVRPVEQDVRKEVRELDEQIQQLRDELTANARRRQLLGERAAYLKQLEGFTSGTANLELKSGVLNAETLKSLTEFVFKERADIAEGELQADIAQRELTAQVQLLERQRNVLTQGSAKTVREAVVFADLGEPGAKSLRLTYIVSDANWSPSYNLRASAEEGRVVVEYNASIQQMSGEAWTDVEMSLSTASPSLVATAPKLEPLAIRLAAPTPQQQEAQRDYAKAKGELMQQQRKLSELRNSYAANGPVFNDMPQAASIPEPTSAADPFGGEGLSRRQSDVAASGFGGGGGFGGMYDSAASGSGRFADLGLNRIGSAVQLLEYNSDLNRGKRASQPDGSAQGFSVSYALPGTTSLPSRSDRQLIQIASLPLAGQFYRVATPVLTEYVYKEARLANDTDLMLLAGPAATFLGGEFVGQGAMPTVAVGESFDVGLGIDTSLRVSRELVKKDARTQGGNRLTDFTYQLAIENFGDKEVDVRLFDRLPKPDNDDIKVTLVKSSQEVSDDPAYQKDDRKNGILRWDLKAPAGATGINQTTLDYTLQIEYDRQLQIVGMK
jgi:hypothetical protein